MPVTLLPPVIAEATWLSPLDPLSLDLFEPSRAIVNQPEPNHLVTRCSIGVTQAADGTRMTAIVAAVRRPIQLTVDHRLHHHRVREAISCIPARRRYLSDILLVGAEIEIINFGSSDDTGT